MAMGKTIGRTKTITASTTTSLFLYFFGNKKIQSGGVEFLVDWTLVYSSFGIYNR
jgi:hypothetical protein